MNPEDEKVFDEQFDKMLAGCPKEVRDIYEAKRAELKKLADKVQLDIKATDDMLRQRLGPLYPFVIQQGDEVLPGPDDIRGIMPNLTGGKPSEKYLKERWEN